MRAYRKKLTSSDPIDQDVLAELDQELRLTSLALGDRAKQSKALSDSVLEGILDQYSTRLVTLLNDKLRNNSHSSEIEEEDLVTRRPGSSDTGSSSSSV